jgi:molybdopterin biosynthesis enzyme MoaB
MRTAVVITASNRASRGEYADLSGESLAKGLTALGYEVSGPHVVADSTDLISEQLTVALANKTRLIVTTGGTGVSPTDVTPEATSDLTRGLVGTHGTSLIINLPGSQGAIADGLVIIERLAGHILDQLDGKDH